MGNKLVSFTDGTDTILPLTNIIDLKPITNASDQTQLYYGSNKVQFNYFNTSTPGTPFGDGFLVTFIWRNLGASATNNYITQIALEDGALDMRIRGMAGNTWSDWKTVLINATEEQNEQDNTTN